MRVGPIKAWPFTVINTHLIALIKAQLCLLLSTGRVVEALREKGRASATKSSVYNILKGNLLWE